MLRAFCNESCAATSAAERFARVANDTSTHEMGLVMEIPMDGVRNPQIPTRGDDGGELDPWQANLLLYAKASLLNGWQDHAIRSIYYGNSFVGMAFDDPYPNTRRWYDQVYAIVKRTWPRKPPNATSLYKSDDGSGPSQPSVAAFNPSFSAPSANGPSQNMPVGNGELVANVWVDGVRNGSLALLLGRSDVFSGNVQPLKLGRLRLSLDPNPFEGCFTRAGQAATPPFSQTLDLQRGLLNISAGDVRITVWSDINGADSVHVQIAAGTPTTVTVAIDSWQVPTQARWSLPHAPALAC